MDTKKKDNPTPDFASKFTNHIDLMLANAQEKGLEPFLELAQKNPKRAIEEFPRVLGQVLSSGNGFFNGTNCGGPFEWVTAPLLNVIGSIYPKLPKDVRGSALSQAMNFLDGLRYDNSQRNVELIQEPWLVGDIYINRDLYWPGSKDYVERLKGITSWQEFESRFMKEDEKGNSYLDAKSLFFLAYTLSRVEDGPQEIRRTFSEIFPDIAERTKDVIAAFIHDWAEYEEADQKRKIPYKKGLEEGIKDYAPEWHDDIRERITQTKWVYLPETIERLERLRAGEKY